MTHNAPDETFRLLMECQGILDTLAATITRAALADKDVSSCEHGIRAMTAALYKAQADAALSINGQKASNDNV